MKYTVPPSVGGGLQSFRFMNLINFNKLTLFSAYLILTGCSFKEADHSSYRLSESDYLADVSEPIRMTRALSWDDGGSTGLEFVDSQGLIKRICLYDKINGQNNLVVDAFVPDPNVGKVIPVGGVEEKAVLGLSERWNRGNPDAQAWGKRIDKWRKSGRTTQLFAEDDDEKQTATAHAVDILKRLRRRN